MTYISRRAAAEEDDWDGFRADLDLLNEDALLSESGRGYLIPGFLPTAGLTVAYGRPKDGAKTAFWLRLARRLSQGLPIFGHAMPHPREATYLVTEDEAGFRDRVEALRCVDGPAPDFRVITKPLNLFSPRCVDELIMAFEASHLVVLDTLGRMMGRCGADENGADMARVISILDTIREQTRVQMVLIHHPAQSTGLPRGHTSLSAAADTVIEHAMLGDGSRTATLKAARDDPSGTLMRYRLRPVGLPGQEFAPARTAIVAEEMDEPPPPAPVAKGKRRRAAAP